MENLTLPEPAASLWAAKRSIVHAIPPEMFGRSIPPINRLGQLDPR